MFVITEEFIVERLQIMLLFWIVEPCLRLVEACSEPLWLRLLLQDLQQFVLLYDQALDFLRKVALAQTFVEL